MKKNAVLTILFSLCFGSTVLAQQIVRNLNENLRYLIYTPNRYEGSGEKYPLLIFLHGVGERGTDIEKVKTHGPPMLIEKGKSFPFIVVSPQSEGEWKADYIYDLIQHLRENYRIDEDRISLTGIGPGTWDIAMTYPSTFAAIAPVCGEGELSRAWRLRHVAVWGFHGAKDEVIPLSASKDLVDEVKKYNSDVLLTVYPEVHHDSWVQAYESPLLYDWMLHKTKFKYSAKAVDAKVLEKYVGTYRDTNNGNTILEIYLSDNSLHVITEVGKHIKMESFADDSFSYQERTVTELVFRKDKKGTVNGFSMMDKNKREYVKTVKR